jgi:hypothetical protein
MRCTRKSISQQQQQQQQQLNHQKHQQYVPNGHGHHRRKTQTRSMVFSGQVPHCTLRCSQPGQVRGSQGSTMVSCALTPETLSTWRTLPTEQCRTRDKSGVDVLQGPASSCLQLRAPFRERVFTRPGQVHMDRDHASMYGHRRALT